MFHLDEPVDCDRIPRRDGATLLVASGELDYGAVPQLRQRMFASIDAGARGLALDLSGVTFIDSMVIGVLLAASARLSELGKGSLRVVCSQHNERVLRIFDIAGVAELIGLDRSREDALGTLARAPSAEVAGPLAPHAQVTAVVDSTSPAPVAAAAAAAAVARRYAAQLAAERKVERATSSSAIRGSQVDELA